MNQILFDNSPDQCNPQAIQLDDMAFDGSGTQIFTFDSATINFGKPDSIRTLFYDNPTGADIICTTITGTIFRLRAGKQGYIPFFQTLDFQLKFTSATANGKVRVVLYSFKVAPAVY